MKQIALFSCLGLGDGLISLVLANNLHLNGYKVTVFHPSLSALQSWFPSILLQEPSTQELDKFDHIYLFVEKTPWMQQLQETLLKNYRSQTTLLNPIATANRDYPYWSEGQFDGTKDLVHNLYTFCQTILKLPVCSRSNGITAPPHLTFCQNPKRIILHPTSSRDGKNWPQAKFLQLADKLEKRGWQPVFILTKEERQQWNLPAAKMPLFANLSELASYTYASGAFVGNDSGPGHLASNLGLPTLSIFRNEKTALFWKPSWGPNRVITPSRWIPNLKGLRWRDKHWKKWISVKRVLEQFQQLCLPEKK